MNIDFSTLAIVLSFVNLLQVIVLVVQSRIDQSHQGLGWWTLGIAVVSLGFVFLHLRAVPGLTSFAIVANNVLFLFGWVFLYIGVLRFFDRREYRGLLIAGLAVFVPLDVFLTYVDDDIVARRALFYGVVAVLSVLTARAILTYKTRAVTGSANFLATVFSISGAMFFVSMASTLINPPPPVVFANSPDQVIGGFTALLITTFITFGFILLVNQRLHAENRDAKDTDAKYRRIVETANEGILSFDRDFRITFTNQRMASMLGYTTGDMLGRPVVDFLAPDQLPDHALRVQSGRRGQDAVYERCFLRQDGARHWALVSARALMDDHREFAGSFAMFTDINERKQAQATLRASEERFRLSFDNANTGMCLVDLRGNILRVNDKMSAIFGYRRQELEGMTVNDLACPEDLDLSSEFIDHAVHGNSDNATFEKRYRHRQGHVIYGQVASSLVRDDQGQPSYFISQVQDITDRKRAEQEIQSLNASLEQRVAARTADLEAEVAERRRAQAQLRRSEETAQRQLAEIKAYYDTAPVGLFVLDTDLRYLRINERLAQFNGQPVAAHLGRTVRELLPDLADRVEPLFQRVIATGEPLLNLAITEETPAQPGGKRVWRADYFPLQNAAGDVIGVNGMAEDITERQAMEEAIRALNADLEGKIEARTADVRAAADALRQSEEKYRSLVETTSDCIWEFDEQARFTYLSPRFRELTGYIPEAYLGKTPLDLLPEGTPSPQRERLAMAMTARRPLAALEMPVRRRDGRPLAVEISALPLCGPEDDYRGMRGMARDITERKEAEAQLVQYREHLEALVESRTRELSEARDAAEAANRAKSAFLANMSHEIRTPMNAILGFTHLLQREITAPRARERLAKVADAGQHLLGILNDILDLSKIEAERLVLERAEFSLQQVFDRVVALVREPAAQKGLALVVEIAPGVPAWLRGDPTRLGQMLANYIGNAIKFSPQGEVGVRARVAQDGPQTVVLRIEVRDQGIGLSEEQQARLFRPFVQADDSTTRQYGGTGLGLIIVKRLAALMGGEVGVTSAPGEGSTFWFTVRLERLRSDAASPPTTSETPEAGTAEQMLARHHRGSRVLLAEDEPINQAVTQELLDSLGFVVDLAQNGREAVERVASASYDLVLMDVQMPVMDGLDATRAIRALPGTGSLPILAMTANAFAQDRARCLEAGMNDHIPKPVAPAVLYETLLRWLPKR